MKKNGISTPGGLAHGGSSTASSAKPAATDEFKYVDKVR